MVLLHQTYPVVEIGKKEKKKNDYRLRIFLMTSLKFSEF